MTKVTFFCAPISSIKFPIKAQSRQEIRDGVFWQLPCLDRYSDQYGNPHKFHYVGKCDEASMIHEQQLGSPFRHMDG
jgi:hypothetical protein